MKKYSVCFIIIIYVCILLNGCDVITHHSEEGTAFLCPQLESSLQSYMSNYPHDSIFRICFFRVSNTDYVQISRMEMYDAKDSAYVDYYSYLDNKLIICFSLDTCSRDSLLYKGKMNKFKGRLSDVKQLPVGSGSDDYNSYPVYLRVISKDSIPVCQDMPRMAKRPCKIQNNIVTNDNINIKLNEYMWKYDGFHYFLRFANYNGTDYVTIGRSDVYEEKEIIGHFWQNDNMIIIYNSGKADVRHYINVDSINPYTNSSINARKGKTDFYFRPDIEKYRINSNGKLTMVDYNSPLYVFI